MPYMSKRSTTGGVVPVGSNLFGTCSTAGGTATKVVTMPDFNVLVEGVTIHVYFSNGNTASAPLLQVGSTTAKNIRYNGANGGTWKSGAFVSFTYYGGYWVQNDVQDGKTYGLSLSGNTLSLVEGGGSQSVTISTQDTTYTLSISGHVLTLTGSDGVTSPVTIPDDDTTYAISISGNVITLTGSDGSTSTVTIPQSTWQQNTKTQDGYVLAGGNQNRKMWMTDANGNPLWDTNLVVISQADYEALSQAEQNNGDVYFVYDYAGVTPYDYVERVFPTYELDTTQPTGTRDGDLYAAINALGWASDVII